MYEHERVTVSIWKRGGPPAASAGCALARGLRDRSRRAESDLATRLFAINLVDIAVRLVGGWSTRQVCDQAGTRIADKHGFRFVVLFLMCVGCQLFVWW